MAETEVSLAQDVTLRLGGDIRLRYEGVTSSVTAPEAQPGPSRTTEYFRMRTRLMGALDFGTDLTVNLRVANRWHYVTTSPNRKNNNGTATWEFPDEFYIDNANIVIRNLLDGHILITLGRQDLMFGNGLIFSEGTPFDQGRSVYTDGVSIKYEDDENTVTAFALYDSWKDRAPVVNNQNRTLRSGDILTLGVYGTHIFRKEFAADVYYMYNNLDDSHPETAEPAHPADASVKMHTVGLRLFGTCPAWMDYSLETACQFGEDARRRNLEGRMLDARLGFHLADESSFKPLLKLEYTHFSGGDPNSSRNEGWNPLMAQCPLWGEELLPTMLFGNWTNLNMKGVNLSASLTEKCTVAVYATDYEADNRNGTVGTSACTGGGRHVGFLSGAMASYAFTKNLSALAYLSHFIPGNFFRDARESNWFRLELTASF